MNKDKSFLDVKDQEQVNEVKETQENLEWSKPQITDMLNIEEAESAVNVGGDDGGYS